MLLVVGVGVSSFLKLVGVEGWRRLNYYVHVVGGGGNVIGMKCCWSVVQSHG